MRISSATRSVRSSCAGADAERLHALGDGIAHGGARVERGARVLHDDLHAAAVGMEMRPSEASDRSTPSNQMLPPVALHEAQDAAPHGGLAAAGLAHQRQRLAAAKS